MRTTCSDIQELLSLLVAGELAPDDAKRVDVHLAGCEACAPLRARLGRVDGLLRTAPVPALSRDELGLMALRARQQPVRVRSARRRLLAAAAVLMALLVPAASYFSFAPCRAGPPGCDAVATAFDMDF